MYVSLAIAASPTGDTGLAPSGMAMSQSQSSSVMAASSQSGMAGGEIVFKSFTFYPDLPLRIDYHGKRIDMAQVRNHGAVVVGRCFRCGIARVFCLACSRD